MKAILLTALAALLALACGSHKGTDSTSSTASLLRGDTITYAYNQQRELTQKDIQFFNRVCEAYGGLQYTPVWLSVSGEGDELLSYFCKGKNGKSVIVVIERPAHGKAVIKEIKQTNSPRKPANVVTVFYDQRVGSAPLDAVIGSLDCEVIERDASLCSVTLRLRKAESRTLLENTKGVLSVTEHQMMPPYNAGN